jgi:hypothetical protein
VRFYEIMNTYRTFQSCSSEPKNHPVIRCAYRVFELARLIDQKQPETAFAHITAGIQLHLLCYAIWKGCNQAIVETYWRQAEKEFRRTGLPLHLWVAELKAHANRLERML